MAKKQRTLSYWSSKRKRTLPPPEFSVLFKKEQWRSTFGKRNRNVGSIRHSWSKSASWLPRLMKPFHLHKKSRTSSDENCFPQIYQFENRWWAYSHWCRNRWRCSEIFGEIVVKRKAYDPSAGNPWVTVEPMVPIGKEVIIGVWKDPQFGHLLMFGLWYLCRNFERRHVSESPYRTSRRDEHDWGKLTTQILKGARGEKPVDPNSIADIEKGESHRDRFSSNFRDGDQSSIVSQQEWWRASIRIVLLSSVYGSIVTQFP